MEWILLLFHSLIPFNFKIKNKAILFAGVMIQMTALLVKKQKFSDENDRKYLTLHLGRQIKTQCTYL